MNAPAMWWLGALTRLRRRPAGRGYGAGQRRQPRSFFRFLVIAFSLVLVPPLITLVSFTVDANVLADRSERAVRRIAWFNQDVLLLQETVPQMERLLRQAIILREAPSAEAYDALHDQFAQSVARLLDAKPPPGVAQELHTLLREEARLDQRLSELPLAGRLPAELPALNQAMDRLTSASTASAAQEIESIRQAFFSAQQRAYYQLAVVVPFAILMAAVFTALLGEPVREIDNAIGRLGDGRLDEAIQIEGPQDIRLLGQRLDWLRLRLKELEADRQLLSQSISHDLKTPLTSISEGIHLLQHGMHGALSPKQQEIVGIMHGSVSAMAGKIESLITLRSSALRDAPLELRPLALRELVESALRDHRLAARAKRLEMAVRGPAARINGDASKLRTVFDNLLSNAVRYSPRGGCIEVELSLEGERVAVAICDEGPGIAPAEAARIFENGYRSAEQPARHVPGSGVGLAIAREFVLAHGGRIDVDPRGSGLRRRGARIVVQLPVS